MAAKIIVLYLSLLFFWTSCEKAKPKTTFNIDRVWQKQQLSKDWDIQKDKPYVAFSSTGQYYNIPRHPFSFLDSSKFIDYEYIGDNISGGGNSTNLCVLATQQGYRSWFRLEWHWLIKDTLTYAVTDSFQEAFNFCDCWGGNTCKNGILPSEASKQDWKCGSFNDFPKDLIRPMHLASLKDAQTKFISLKNADEFSLFKDIIYQMPSINPKSPLDTLLQNMQSPEWPNFQSNHVHYKAAYEQFNASEFMRDSSYLRSNFTVIRKYISGKYIPLTINQLYNFKAWSPCQKEPLEYKDIAAYAWLAKPSFIYFKKYHNYSPNEWYYYFVFYYFKFDKDNKAELLDIEIVMPPKFGINVKAQSLVMEFNSADPKYRYLRKK